MDRALRRDTRPRGKLAPMLDFLLDAISDRPATYLVVAGIVFVDDFTRTGASFPSTPWRRPSGAYTALLGDIGGNAFRDALWQPLLIGLGVAVVLGLCAEVLGRRACGGQTHRRRSSTPAPSGLRRVRPAAGPIHHAGKRRSLGYAAAGDIKWWRGVVRRVAAERDFSARGGSPPRRSARPRRRGGNAVRAATVARRSRC